MFADRSTCGKVFNIQKFSVNDGPGIRTVVFLKGCPLRCRWCANPESQLVRLQILWDSAKCLHCGHCAQVCPVQAVSFTDAGICVCHENCTSCGICAQGCPGRALQLEGEKKSVQQVIDVVLQDQPFYEESGGGLTLSGGEFLMQPRFSRNMLLAAKEEGLHTCCETTGFAEQGVFISVIDLLDVILFDMKHWDPEVHRRATGVSNELPLQNLRTAITAGKDVLPRIPVIPDFNNALSDAVHFSSQLKKIGAERCQLLPFHQFGENKYKLLGRDYDYHDVPALHREELEEYRQVFLDHGISAFF